MDNWKLKFFKVSFLIALKLCLGMLRDKSNTKMFETLKIRYVHVFCNRHFP